MKYLALFIALLVTAWSVQAIDTAPAFEDEAKQARYDRFIRELRCLQCRSETIADSNAPLAADLRRELRDLIAAGKSDAEITKFMTDRYGDYVLYRPPLAPRTWLLWAAPVLFVVIGVAAAVTIVLRKSRLPDDDPADPGLGAS